MYTTSSQSYGNYYKLLEQNQSQIKQSNQAQIKQSSQSIQNQQPIKRVGLLNIGNSCYINSILQCLFNTKEVNSYFKQLGTQQITKSQPFLQSFLILWFKVTQAQFQPDEEDLKYFREQLGERYKGFANIFQQDAMELFQVLLEQLSNDIKLILPKQKKSTNQDSWVQYIEKELTPFNLIFTGQVTHKMQCVNCTSEQQQLEGFSNIALSIPSTPQKIQNLLQNYFNPEYLQSNVQCGQCKNIAQIVKTSLISRLPNVLVVQLKCYNFNVELEQQMKDHQNISIEPQINLKSFCDPSILLEDCKYTLYAVVNHQGVIFSGHYTSLILDDKKVWANYNDSRISEYSQDYVINELAKSKYSYILFYQQN